MTHDPWADVRVNLEFARLENIVRLLSDADALLAVVRAARYWNSDGPTDELQEAFDALPEHLRGGAWNPAGEKGG